VKTLKKTEYVVFGLFFVFTAFWILVRLPTPTQVLADADGGHQLAGAIQILHGEHPFVDYEATYGPFTFYASALAQFLSGDRVIGEIVLVLVGYAVAYAFLARLVYRLTGKFWLTLLFGLLALTAIPRLYKYYLVLGPVLTIWLAWNYLEKPTWKNMLWLALSITVAGLFRSDFGVYCVLAGLVTVFLALPFKQGGLKRVALFLGAVFLFALPWLLFLAIRGGLDNYFRDMLVGGTNIAVGMSLPFPVYHAGSSLFSVENLGFFAVVFFFSLPLLIFAVLFFRWRNLEAGQRNKVLVTAVLSLFSLLQASHRADYAHLLQTIPLAFVLSAWLVQLLWNSLSAFHRAGQLQWLAFLALLALLFAFLLTPTGLISKNGWPPVDFSGVFTKLAQFSGPKQELLNTVDKKSNSWYADAMVYIRRCTTPQQRLMALPALTTFYYFTDRSFGGGQIGVLSGYFVTDPDQARVVRIMAAQDIPLLVYMPNYEFDGIPQRKLEVVAPQVAGYIQTHYTQIQTIGPASLLLRNDLKIDQPAAKLADMACPHP
jgi:hypothetical protein